MTPPTVFTLYRYDIIVLGEVSLHRWTWPIDRLANKERESECETPIPAKTLAENNTFTVNLLSRSTMTKTSGLTYRGLGQDHVDT